MRNVIKALIIIMVMTTNGYSVVTEKPDYTKMARDAMQNQVNPLTDNHPKRETAAMVGLMESAFLCQQKNKKEESCMEDYAICLGDHITHYNNKGEKNKFNSDSEFTNLTRVCVDIVSKKKWLNK